MSATWKPVGVLALAFSAVTVLPTIATAAGVANPTFTKDIAPIFQQKCESCHRPDSMAPMSLMTYEDARPWARSIRTRVDTRQMPPWAIDKTVGIQDFKNDRSLSDDQIATIVNWIDAGCAEGRPERHAGAGAVAGRSGLEPREELRTDRAGSRDPLDAVDAESRRQRHLVASGRRDRAHRASLGSRDRNPPEHGEGPQDHAPRHRQPAAG